MDIQHTTYGYILFVSYEPEPEFPKAIPVPYHVPYQQYNEHIIFDILFGYISYFLLGFGRQVDV